MNTLELARLQFGITTLFHFIFVPMSIGLAVWVATCQTLYHRSGSEVYLRMTRFWGKLMLISIAVGVVTGLVQEFQFGMNWSQYSRYVGDIFGAPLAMEGLGAFFLESTFIGLWVFGWNRLSPRIHLATIWLTAFGAVLSAYFILAANSWMQHPVGYVINHATGRAELKDIFAVLTNSTVLLAMPHTVFGALATAGMLVLGISAWGMLRGRSVELYSRSARLVLPLTLFAAMLTGVAGHGQGLLMEKQQPMKMASAEALYNTSSGAGFSVFATGDFTRNPHHLTHDLRIPHLLSILADGSWNGQVKGIDQIQREEVAKYGPGDYVPIVGVTYWTFRVMAGIGFLLVLLPIIGLVLMRRRGRLERAHWFQRLAIVGIVLPILANLTGWIFTEMGRQPWVVFGMLRTDRASSPNVSSTSLLITLLGYTVLYGVLAAVAGRLFVREIQHGPQPPADETSESTPIPPELVLAY
ncbi:MAG TPA: cytochrome ubiquinol oxidase subunit I [Solirubrobacteraceae bacterium]